MPAPNDHPLTLRVDRPGGQRVEQGADTPAGICRATKVLAGYITDGTWTVLVRPGKATP